jgi:hypothetical protein
MALVKLGAIAQDVRGSLNGMVFSRNRGGAYVRTKVSPVQPVSQWSARTREIFRDVSQFWANTVTPAERQAWEEWAALHPIVNVFGDSVILSGVAAFQLVKARLAMVGVAPSGSVPGSWVVTDPGVPTLVAELTGAVLELTVTAENALTGDEAWFIAWTRSQPASRKPQLADFLNVNLVALAEIADAADHGPAYVTRIGGFPPAVDDVLWVRASVINTETGCCAVPFVGSVVVTEAAP